MQILGIFVHGISYRPTDLSLLKDIWNAIWNFKHDCNFSSE